MGTVKNPNAVKPTYLYSRAFSKKNRNRIWRGIVSKTDYSVDILWETDDKKEIFSKEMEFISIYGRRDRNTGTLANLTDGGDGSTNLSKEVIKRTVEKNRANGCFQKTGKIRAELNRSMGNVYKGRERDEGYPGFVPCFIYNSDGTFYGKFNSRRDAAKSLGMRKDVLGEAIRKEKVMRSGKVGFNEYMGEKIPPPISKRCKTVYKICPQTGSVAQKFLSSTESMKYIGVGSNVMCQIIKDKRIYKGYIWSFKELVVLSEYRLSKAVSPRGVRKTTCAKCGKEKQGKMITYSYCHKCSAERMKLIKTSKK